MNRLEALKAMLDGKKVGHPKLVHGSYYVLEERRDPIRLKQEYDQTDSNSEMSYDDGYYIIKNKVKKYKVLYKVNGELYISQAYFSSVEDFDQHLKPLKPLQILESTMIEVEE